MGTKRWSRAAVVATSMLLGCGDTALAPDRSATARVDAAQSDRRTVVVSKEAHGNGVATTVQEGIDMVAEGGRVKVKPGRYDEQVVINKGVTLEGSDLESGPAVISQIRDATSGSAPATEGVIQIETTQPVVIRDLTVKQDNIRGINALFRGVDLTVERVIFEGVSDVAPIVGNGVTVTNNASESGGRAHLVVRESRFSVGGVGMVIGGDVDAELVANQVQHVRSRSVCVIVNPTGQGTGATVPAGAATNVTIRDNLFENCGTDALRFPGRGFNFIAVQGAPGAATSGAIVIVNNTFRTTAAVPGAPDACPSSGILFEHYSGAIEHNSLINVVPACAVTGPRNAPGAIYVGSRVAGIRAAGPVQVRFNDIAGNAFAGLRIGSNQPTPFDATCNWWGDPSGPSGVGSGSGDAVLIDGQGAVPVFTPFATGPIAGTGENSC
jgi:hypothetical protein